MLEFKVEIDFANVPLSDRVSTRGALDVYKAITVSNGLLHLLREYDFL